MSPDRGSEGSGRDRHSAPEQSHPAGEFPEADGAAERPDRYRELDGTRQGECSDAKQRLEGAEKLSECFRVYLTNFVVFSGVYSRGLSVQAYQERTAAENVFPGWYKLTEAVINASILPKSIVIKNDSKCFCCLFSSQTCSSTQAKV